MVTFETIQAANAAIRTTDIKGKEYAEVNQRIKAFRMVYPEGTIETEMLSNSGGVSIFRAVVANAGNVLGTGTAYEKENSSYINKTSYIENCETSAVGRALGMAGFGIDTSVASADEVRNAILQQERSVSITHEEAEVLDSMIRAVKAKDSAEERIQKICSYYKVKQLSDLTPEQYARLIKQLQEVPE